MIRPLNTMLLTEPAELVYHWDWVGRLLTQDEACREVDKTDRLFYDGHCGMCHGLVLFVLARDSAGHFRFAPLDSDAFRAAVPESSRARLPDSIVLLSPDGKLLTRSDAVVYILRRLGGFWWLVGKVIGFIPVSVRDWGYDRVARVRHRLFRRPEDSCPIVPAHLRDRFDV